MSSTVILIIIVPLFSSAVWAFKSDEMVVIPGGEYLPFIESNSSKSSSFSFSKLKTVRRKPIKVPGFSIDKYPVTNEAFLKFVKKNPQWRKSMLKRIFTEKGYLKHWSSDDNFGKGVSAKAPVSNISWFAAKAYCEWLGKKLPTVDQWEYIASDHGESEKQMKEVILNWYTKPTPRRLPNVGSTEKNSFGVYDMYGLIWEWTSDFNSVLITNDSESGLFCGAGGKSASDPTNYAAFMRYAFRSSLKGNYTVENLGFRCAKEKN